MSGADFDDAPMIESICINQHRLRMCLLKHLLEIGEEQILREVILCGVTRRHLLIGFRNADDLDLRAVQRTFKKSLHVAVYQSYDADAQRGLCERKRCQKCEERDDQ